MSNLGRLTIAAVHNADTDIRNFAPVARIMKTALPENAKIAKEAKECMQECVSEFISFITSEGRPVLLDASMQLKTDESACSARGDPQLRKSANKKKGRLSMARISCLP